MVIIDAHCARLIVVDLWQTQNRKKSNGEEMDRFQLPVAHSSSATLPSVFFLYHW